MNELEKLIDNNLNSILEPDLEPGPPPELDDDEIDDYLYGKRADEIDRFLNDIPEQ